MALENLIYLVPHYEINNAYRHQRYVERVMTVTGQRADVDC